MVGKRLRFLRVSKNLSQQELGDILMISHHTVSSYEKDKSDPSDEIKLKIARYFNVSMDYLLGLVEEPLPFAAPENMLRLPGELPQSSRAEIENFVRYVAQRDTFVTHA